MSETTGPILAVGAISLANEVVFNRKEVDWRIPLATGVAVGFFALAEKGWRNGAVGLAYLSLVTVLFVRLDPNTPAPIENINNALNWVTRK